MCRVQRPAMLLARGRDMNYYIYIYMYQILHMALVVFFNDAGGGRTKDRRVQSQAPHPLSYGRSGLGCSN